jgi:prolyl-tRNA synthetase
LSGFRLYVDRREEVTPGFKYNEWELRGVPLRIEIGPKDVEKGSVALARRDMPGRAGKSFVTQAGLAVQVATVLDEIQASLFQRALEFRQANTYEPSDYAGLVEAVQKGWAFAWWCGDPECEAKVKEETKATTRCIPLDQPGGNGPCVVCGERSSEKIYFARAY